MMGWYGNGGMGWLGWLGMGVLCPATAKLPT